MRDRRTIVTLVAMPLLLYPLLSVAFLQFAALGKADAGSGAAYVLGFTRVEEARVFLARLSQGEAALQDRPNHKKAAPKIESRLGTEEELRVGLKDGTLDLVVRVPEAARIVAPEADIEQGAPPFALAGKDWDFECELVFLAGAPGGHGALALVERRLAAADATDLTRRLNRPGVGPPTVVLRPALVAIKAEEADSAASLVALVPLILILMTVTGAVYPAIDLTAGERERGTLEILVAAPVPRFELLTAKYLAVVAVAVLTGVVNLVSMTITLEVSGLGKQLLGANVLSPLLIVQMFALLLLFAAFFSAVLLSLTSFARSFKEAQAYLIPLMLGSLAPGMLAMLPGIRLRAELAVLPLINIVLLARDLFEDRADPLLAGVVVVTTLLYALAALALAARVFGAESVLYSEQSGWADLLRRPEEPASAPGLASAFWCLALAVPIHFFAQSLLIQWQPSEPVLLGFVAILSVLLFVGLPAAAAYLGRVHWTASFGLAVPRPAALLAGLVLGASLWPLVLRFLQQGTAIEERHEAVLAAMQNARDAWPLLLAATIIAAATEELFFRGYLFAALRARSGPVVTIAVTAVLFGVTHVFHGGPLGLDRLVPSTLLGLVLGVVCWLSGSVVPGLILHVAYNTALVLVLVLHGAEGDAVPVAWVVAAAIGTLAGLALLLAGRRVPAPRAGEPRPSE